MINISTNFKNVISNNKLVRDAISKRCDDLRDNLTDAVVHDLNVKSNGDLDIEVSRGRHSTKIGAYGPDAMRVEERTHAFETVFAVLPNILKRVNW
jgi:hypothetical protein